jgi:hypothetical protein
VFLNREEIPVRALYRDPVHDFGFFSFDPALLQFMEARPPSSTHAGMRLSLSC